MTSSTLWTQQLLNILISWLRDQTQACSSGTALHVLGSKKSKANHHSHHIWAFFSSCPHHQAVEQPTLAFEPSYIVSVRAEGPKHWRWTITTMIMKILH